MKTLTLVLLSLLVVAPPAFCAGLGDTLESINAEYGKKVQANEMFAFGKPLRAERLDGNANKGLFGAPSNTNPTEQQFFNGIRRLIPSDAKLVNSYKQDGDWRKEIYTFKSVALTNVPNIKETVAYAAKYSNHPVGTFTMYVNYDIDDKNRVACFTIVLGLPEEVDLEHMKKMSKNPFK